MNKKILALLITGFFAVCGFPSLSHSESVEGASAKFVATTLDGKAFNLASLQGKVVIINFWATWCTPCREEMPVLADFYLHHKAEGVEVLAVSVDRERARDKVIKYMGAFHIPTSLISDATENDFDTPRILPVTYVIDANGIVRKIFTPDQETLTKQSLDDNIVPLLQK